MNVFGLDGIHREGESGASLLYFDKDSDHGVGMTPDDYRLRIGLFGVERHKFSHQGFIGKRTGNTGIFDNDRRLWKLHGGDIRRTLNMIRT